MADPPVPPAPARRPRRRSPSPEPPAAEAPASPVDALPEAPLDLEQVSVGTLTAERVEMNQGAVARAQVGQLSMHQGAAALVEAKGSVRLEQSGSLVVVGRHVELGPGSGALVVFAREVHGDTTPLLDWRGALALGAGFGLVVSLVRGARRRG